MFPLHLLGAGGATPPPASIHKRIAIQGQSNAVGQGEQYDFTVAPLLTYDPGLAGLYAATFSRVYIWNPVTGQYEQLRMGTNSSGAGTASTRHGPEFGLAVKWMRSTTEGNLYIDKRAVSGTAISLYKPGGAQYTATLAERPAQDAWLAANGVAPDFVGFLWVQGESDTNTTQSAYTTALNDLFSTRIADGLQPAWARVVLTQMVAGTNGYRQAVYDAKVAYAAANADTTLADDVPYYGGDNLHWNARGLLHVAYSAFAWLFNATEEVPV